MSTRCLLLKLNMPVVLQLSLAHAYAPQAKHSLISTLTRRIIGTGASLRNGTAK